MTGLLILLSTYFISDTTATIDLTLPELQHLASHMTRDECEKLVAALHFNSFKLELYKSLEDAENALPEDVSCLQLLLEWNSNEGRGKTHEKLSLRLRQMGRQDLASWLDGAVLKELREEVDKVAQELTEGPEERNPPTRQAFEDPDEYEKKLIRNDEIWDIIPVVIKTISITTFSFAILYILNHVLRNYRLTRWEKVEKELKINEYKFKANYRENMNEDGNYISDKETLISK
jgi:hypothetical protein